MKQRTGFALLVLALAVAVVLIIGIGHKPVKVATGIDASDFRLAQLGERVDTEAAAATGSEVCFHGFVQLGKDVANSTAMLELTLYTKVACNLRSGIYELTDPKLEINPIGCYELDKDKELVAGSEYSVNCHFGTKQNQEYYQTMPAGCAKILANSGNITILGVSVMGSDRSDISFVQSLMAAGNDVLVGVNYQNMAEYFDEWYAVEFILVSDKTGYFTVY